MEIRPIEITKIDEIKILSNVRLIYKYDLNHVYTKKNWRAQFEFQGEVKGAVTCFLCLDQQELDLSDQNYIFPLFIESMNILMGKQISLDPQLSPFRIKLSPPKFSMTHTEINSAYKVMMQSYELELEGFNFPILIEYSLEAMN